MSITTAQLSPIRDAGLASFAALNGPSMLRGVNLAGADFGSLPGTLGTTYTFPTTAELSYYYAKGMRCARIPFLWERIQPMLGGTLDAAHLAWLHSLAAFAPDMVIVLDLHSYGGYNGNFIDMTNGPTIAQFSNLWTKLAIEFKGSSNVYFGLINEPHVQPASQWANIAKSAVAAIRAVGATNAILVPGTAFTGAWSWIASGNGAALQSLQDQNCIIEVHQYFDADSSGQNATAVSATIASQRLAAITQWARTNCLRLALGEFGAANNPTMLSALTDCVQYMQSNPDVWSLWTYWAGGPWWGSYMYSIEPDTSGDKLQMTTLLPYLS